VPANVEPAEEPTLCRYAEGRRKILGDDIRNVALIRPGRDFDAGPASICGERQRQKGRHTRTRNGSRSRQAIPTRAPHPGGMPGLGAETASSRQEPP
jgi:hypothetical protein